ncbi:MAG: TonB-dependent receptor [Dysgonamonadaceae bacterium]|jgi:outer membrane receptor for ferrienterochelin and colicin|nr:TonB-dependent receptor [Dysgonamonadaceae bacterium]
MKQIIIILSLILLGATTHLSAQVHNHNHNHDCEHDHDTDSLEIWKDIELKEVNVVSSVGLLNMRTPVIRTQKITSHELSRAACCNLSESFTTNPSVDVTYNDAATGSKQIKLLGLSGTYVQMLTENFPNLRGLASTYGLNYIPGPWMESIMLSKGSSSVLNGYESITGQINVEYKKPETSEKLALNLFASDEGRFEANLTSGIILNERLSTGILAHAQNSTFEIDHNGDGFLDQPKVKQYQLFNRWDYEGDDFHVRAGIKALREERNGGQIKSIPNPYKIGIETDRYEFFLKGGYILNEEKDRSFGIIMSGSQHEQDSYYGYRTYDARQTNLYTNFIFSTRFDEHHKLSAGASLNSDLYNEKWQNGQDEMLRNFERKELVPGIFGEYTLNFHEHLTILLGLRGDHHNLYGFFATPRVHVKYDVSDYFQLRASAGKGYRTPNILAENSYLFASNRQIKNIDLLKDLKQEEAWNYGLSMSFYIPVNNKDLTLNAEWYYTNFLEQVVVDMDTDPHSVNFHNLDGRSYSNSIQLEASYEIIDLWTMTLAHRILDVKTTINGELREKPLNSRFKSLLTTSYQTLNGKWQFDLTAQLNGGGRMPDPDINNPLWDREFKPFVQLQCQITKNFKTWSVYVGSENLTNFVQKNPIISADNPQSPNFDASMVWGPILGRMFYVGLKWIISD